MPVSRATKDILSSLAEPFIRSLPSFAGDCPRPNLSNRPKVNKSDDVTAWGKPWIKEVTAWGKPWIKEEYKDAHLLGAC